MVGLSYFISTYVFSVRTTTTTTFSTNLLPYKERYKTQKGVGWIMLITTDYEVLTLPKIIDCTTLCPNCIIPAQISPLSMLSLLVVLV